MTNFMRFGVLSTWLFLGLGFLIDPSFFALGFMVFVVVGILWTVQAIRDKVPLHTFLWVWGLPIVMISVLGFAVMWLPELPSENKEEE